MKLRKNSLITLIILFLTTAMSLDAFAKRRSSYKSKNKTKYRLSQKQVDKKIGFNFYIYNNYADRLITTGNSNYDNQRSGYTSMPTASLTGEYQTTSSLGLGAEYSMPTLVIAGPVGFGAAAGFTYELDREVDRALIENDRDFDTRFASDRVGNPSFNLTLPYINATANYGSTYAFAGLNWAIPNFSNAGNEEYIGQMGYQFGFGAKVTSLISVEAGYRLVNFDADPNFEDLVNRESRRNIFDEIDVSERSGLGVLADESLELSGINLSIRISI